MDPFLYGFTHDLGYYLFGYIVHKQQVPIALQRTGLDVRTGNITIRAENQFPKILTRRITFVQTVTEQIAQLFRRQGEPAAASTKISIQIGMGFD